MTKPRDRAASSGLRRARLCALTLACLGAACGERPESYEAGFGKVEAFGLTDRVALVDGLASRAVVLTARADQQVDRASVKVGRGVTRALASADQKRLFVLSAGVVPRRKAEDERPSLTVLEAPATLGADTVVRRFALESPHSGLALDPLGRYAAVFAAPTPAGAGGSSVFLENPNEIIIVDLASPDEKAAVPRTLRSFGGRPQRLTFTPVLALPGGPRRLLVVETDQDISLLDLDHVGDTPTRPEITVRLTSGASTKALAPAGVVVDDGDPAKNDDARIGVRLSNDPSVVTLTLGPRAADPPGTPAAVGALNDFSPQLNLTDVGGIPGDIAWVRTDAGVRLAAVVPGTQSAVLVEPQTSVTTKVDLPARFDRISLITDVVGAVQPGAARTDVALLFSQNAAAAGVAFWALGKTKDQPYRSVEVVSLASPVTRVIDVPAPRAELKVLQLASRDIFVLNLGTRTAAPLTLQSQPTVHISADGQRLWAFQANGSALAQVPFENLHPIQLPLDRSISAVFEIARPDGRSLLAVDGRSAVGVTALDALAPDTVASRSYYGLLLEGLQ